MEFIHELNAVKVYNEEKEVIAQIDFPNESADVVEINHTFVSDVLRGQGIAGKLMQEAVKNIQDSNRKANPTCSYAVNWFEKHPEHKDLLK